MIIALHPEAADDFARAAEYYASAEPGLGQHFYQHVNQLMAEIEAVSYKPSEALALSHRTPGLPWLRTTAALRSRKSSSSSTRERSRAIS